MWNRLSLNINKNIIMSIKMEWTYYGVRGKLYGVPLVDKEPQSVNDWLPRGKVPAFSGDEPPNWLSNAVWSALKPYIHLQQKENGLNRIYTYKYVHTLCFKYFYCSLVFHSNVGYVWNNFCSGFNKCITKYISK